jgi:peptidoglycan/LPS O-acetylase OafA/YrhL
LGVVAALVPLPLDWLWSYRATNLIYSLWALPSVFWGIALACLYSRGKEGDLYRGSGYAYFGLGLLLVCTLALAFTSSDRLVENLSGLGLALFAFSNLRGKVINLLARLGKLSFGIYLSHVLFLGACRAIATRVGFDTTLGFAILATAVTLACSSVLTGLLLKSPGLRWLGK